MPRRPTSVHVALAFVLLLPLACTGTGNPPSTSSSSTSPAATSPTSPRPTTPTASTPPTTAARTDPDIVLILTDDQRWDTIWAMPQVQEGLTEKGVEFTNAFVVNPMCCPSRASTLAGQYSHSTGVYKNSSPDGGYEAFDATSTVATWLHDAGYRTALIGKYLNGYEEEQTAIVPPGWDTWFAFTSTSGNGDYSGGSVSRGGEALSLGDGYSTDLLADQATSFIRSTPSTESLFLYFAPKAPHLPATPAPEYEQAFSELDPHRPPSFNEADVSDKPAYARDQPLLTADEIAEVDQTRKDQLRTLQSVDDAVTEILEALAETGRLSTTLVVFTSDNGWLWGEHRRDGKSVPYEESIRVPLIVRYDPFTSTARRDDRLIVNIDLAPTFADLAGTDAPGVEGLSFLPLLQGDATWREDFLIEHLGAGATYCAVRSSIHLYVIYKTGEEELYDLEADPYQLENLAGDPALNATLVAMRDRVRELCDPAVPGVSLK